MGIAAYNRGSRAISAQITAESQQKVLIVQDIPNPRGFMHDQPSQPDLCGYWTIDRDPHKPEAGDRVYCTVSACRGWMTVTEIKGSGRDIRIKTDEFGRTWGYGHNFTRNPPSWMTK